MFAIVRFENAAGPAQRDALGERGGILARERHAVKDYLPAGIAKILPARLSAFEGGGANFAPMRHRLYRGPVLRHPAGLIQAANFRSVVAF